MTLERRLELVMIGVWALVILGIFMLFNNMFIDPLSKATKDLADKKIVMSTNFIAYGETLEEINHNYTEANKTMMLINGKWMSCCPTRWMDNDELFTQGQSTDSNIIMCLRTNETCYEARP